MIWALTSRFHNSSSTQTVDGSGAAGPDPGQHDQQQCRQPQQAAAAGQGSQGLADSRRPVEQVQQAGREHYQQRQFQQRHPDADMQTAGQARQQHRHQRIATHRHDQYRSGCGDILGSGPEQAEPEPETDQLHHPLTRNATTDSSSPLS